MNGKPCPIAKSLDFLGKKYTLLIVRDLLDGPKRFTELANSVVGISTKTLTERLEEMQCNGFLSRKEFATTPPKVEYTLTKKGLKLRNLLNSLKSLGGDF